MFPSFMSLTLLIAFWIVGKCPSIELEPTEILDFEDHFGAVPFDRSRDVLSANTALLSTALQNFGSNRVIRIPENRIFYLEHGVRADSIHDAVLQIDGTLHFVRTYDETDDDRSHSRPSPCLLMAYCRNITITSTTNNKGVLDGGGPQWWGLPGIGYLQSVEHRPILLHITGSQHVVVENILLRDAPLYTLQLENINHATVRHVDIVNRRTRSDGHGLLDLSAFNTDGIDVSGHNVHVHDVSIWNQDDCIAVKDNYFGDLISSNMTFERIQASGLGLVIGSIGGSTVRNITFRDTDLYHSFKGIYLKFRYDNLTTDHRPGLIEDILFENITMEAPEQWGIWIGPAQQSDGRNPCAAHPCSLCWPFVPGAKCLGEPVSKYRNITLRNVAINNPKRSPGVVLGSLANKIEGVVFDNVVVTQSEPQGRLALSLSKLHVLNVLHRPILAQLLIGTVLLFFAILLLLCRSSTKTVAAGRRRGSHRTIPVPAWLIPLMIAGASTVGWLVHVDQELSNHDRYFVCDGVANGVATGRTWPVPYCFDDQTEPHDDSMPQGGQ